MQPTKISETCSRRQVRRPGHVDRLHRPSPVGVHHQYIPRRSGGEEQLEQPPPPRFRRILDRHGPMGAHHLWDALKPQPGSSVHLGKSGPVGYPPGRRVVFPLLPPVHLHAVQQRDFNGHLRHGGSDGRPVHIRAGRVGDAAEMVRVCAGAGPVVPSLAAGGLPAHRVGVQRPGEGAKALPLRRREGQDLLHHRCRGGVGDRRDNGLPAGVGSEHLSPGHRRQHHIWCIDHLRRHPLPTGGSTVHAEEGFHLLGVELDHIRRLRDHIFHLLHRLQESDNQRLDSGRGRRPDTDDHRAAPGHRPDTEVGGPPFLPGAVRPS